MGERKAWSSASAAEVEAVKRFGDQNWIKLLDLQGGIEQAARSDDIAQGFARVALARRHLRAAIVELRRARSLAEVAMQWFDPYMGDFMPSGPLLDLPDLCAAALDGARAAEDASQEGRPGRVGAGRAWRDKVGLMRAALRAGVEPVSGTAGPAWAYAFIALDLDKPLKPSHVPGSDRAAWQRRLAGTNAALRGAKGSTDTK